MSGWDAVAVGSWRDIGRRSAGTRAGVMLLLAVMFLALAQPAPAARPRSRASQPAAPRMATADATDSSRAATNISPVSAPAAARAIS